MENLLEPELPAYAGCTFPVPRSPFPFFAAMSRATAATIHLGALRDNLRGACASSRRREVMAVVKADGYGHGLERVARALDGEADAFGVAGIADGQRLRAAGHRQRIVVLSGPDDAGDLAEMRRLRLESAIHHDAQIDGSRRPIPTRGRCASG